MYYRYIEYTCVGYEKGNNMKYTKFEKIFSTILYALPVLFLTSCYFLMSVTGEDLLQGAGLKENYLSGAEMAFEYNARLSDMYAWMVIRFFDYRFSFGIDTIFRTLDVLMGTGIIYIIAYVSIGRRLRMRISDALVFNIVFCAVFLNRNCDSLYVAFSHIHNYLIIGIFSMLFFVPFARKAQGFSLPDSWWFKLIILVSGFLFGFSSNVTPVAFLICFTVCMIIRLIYIICKKENIRFKKIILSWEAFAVIGVILSCLLMYCQGKGYSAYINEEYIKMTDYISFENIFSNPAEFIPKTINHIYENFYAMLPCLVLLFIALLLEIAAYKTDVESDNNRCGITFLSICTLFVVIHVLAVSQIELVSIIRLVMPAYFVSVSAVFFSMIKLIKRIDLKRAFLSFISVIMIVFTSTMVVDVAVHRYEYNGQIEKVLQAINKTENGFYYIPYTNIHIEESNFFGFIQYKFLQEWMVGEAEVYGKTVYIDYNG